MELNKDNEKKNQNLIEKYRAKQEQKFNLFLIRRIAMKYFSNEKWHLNNYIKL